MLRKLVCAMAVMVFAFSVAMAEEFMGAIKKVEDGRITVTKFKGKKPGEDVVLTVADKVKVKNATAKFNPEEKKLEVTVGDDLKDGLKNERFANIGKGGVMTQIVTNNDNKVTEIRVLPPFQFKGKPKDDK